MRNIFEIHQGDKIVGKAEIQEEGLYYRITCKCTLSGTVMYKVWVCWENQKRSLGILSPENGMFSIETRVPMKSVGSGELLFELIPYRRPGQGMFIPIAPEEPFQYLSRLRNGHMERRDGSVGIVIE